MEISKRWWIILSRGYRLVKKQVPVAVQKLRVYMTIKMERNTCKQITANIDG
jgi:hypothetical protein